MPTVLKSGSLNLLEPSEPVLNSGSRNLLEPSEPVLKSGSLNLLEPSEPVLKSGSLNLLEPSGPVQGCTKIALLTERNSDICHQHNDNVGDQEPQETGVEAHQVVGDAGKDEGQGGEDGHFGQRLAQEVYVDTVHAVEVFPQEDGHLSAEHLDIDVKIYLELFAVT